MEQYNGNMAGQRAKYFMYARKSTESEDRQVASIESQIGELRKLAGTNGLEIVEELSEAKSAKAPGRPVFSDMIRRIDRGEAQGIICWKLDRLARNPIDGGTISWMLQQGKLMHIQTYERAYWPTDNVLMMSVEFGMANQYVRDLSTNVKRELRRKADMGWRPGKAPPGYLNTPDREKGHKVIIKDPALFPVVRKMFELVMDKTYTPSAVWRMATNDWGFRMHNGHKMTQSNFYCMLRSPFYYGVYEYPKGSGNWHQGNHPAMLTKSEFDRMQQRLDIKVRTRPCNYEFPYRGMIRCGECGAAITAEYKARKLTNGNVNVHSYYHCTWNGRKDCSQHTSLTSRELEQQIADIISGLELSPGFCDWALDILKNEHASESSTRTAILEQRRKAYDACVKKLDKLLELRISEGIDGETFGAKKQELVKEKSVLANLIADSDRRVDNWLVRAEDVFCFAKTARTSFERGNCEKKREILSLLGTNWTLLNGKVSLTLDEPIKHIARCAALARGRSLALPETPMLAQNAPVEPRNGKSGMLRRTMAEVAADVRHSENSMLVRGKNVPDYMFGTAPRATTTGTFDTVAAKATKNAAPTEKASHVRSPEMPDITALEHKNEAARRRETGEPRHNIPKVLRD